MSIFICWSGKRSKRVADAVKTLLCETLSEEVFISDDLEKGTTWFEFITKQLRTSTAGIVCLTAENLDSPWLHFEAGALASHFAQADTTNPSLVSDQPGRLFTLLHKVTAAELKGPISAYQATSTTRQEMSKLVSDLARILAKDKNAVNVVCDEKWTIFQKQIDKLTIPVCELIPELDSLFQRKSFYGPLYRCADQAWLNRYDTVRLTHNKLYEYLERVHAACPLDERGLFEMLLAELDGYAMAIGSLLLETKKFQLGKPGELEMEEGIRTCCEGRRLAIRSLAVRLLSPLGSPQREEAARFMGAETNAERKMIVHRLEGTIRRKWEETLKLASKKQKPESLPSECQQAIECLVSPGKAIDFRESSWDLDRIYYYLLVQYFRRGVLASGRGEDGSCKPADNEFLCAARDVEMEVECFWARSKGGSLIPLTYALVALKALGLERPPHGPEARSAIANALNLVETDLKTLPIDSEAARPIFRLLDQIRSLPAGP
jgi:hypothetical protein